MINNWAVCIKSESEVPFIKSDMTKGCCFDSLRAWTTFVLGFKCKKTQCYDRVCYSPGSVLCTRVYLPLDSPKYMYIYIAVQSWSGTAEWIKVPYTDDCWTVHFLSLVATYVCQSQRHLREAQWQAWSPSSSQYNQRTSGRAPVWCMHVHIFPRGNMYTTFLKKQNVWYSCRFGGGGSYREQRRRPKVLK